MYIEELVIDGFKSYAQRTVIQGFDIRFNAITGLNGSGKSNILDAICFVLGISNLSQVRASNLQELVYKQGQAGVTKASVTIVFNNVKKDSSPVGYEQLDQITVTRQVVIGGRNKYLINGHNAQPQRVQNLFHSVQLNVNNPHFLIMQGRITKVLNMKPQEIRGMLEEAAGTRMYENKKLSALKTIEKKQRKQEEITQILDEEITPKLDKLKADRTVYLEFQKNRMEMDTLHRLCIAYEYQQAEQVREHSDEALSLLVKELDDLRLSTKSTSEELADVKLKMSTLQKKRAAEAGSTVLKELEAKASQLSKSLVKRNTVHANKVEVVDAEKKNLVELTKQLTLYEQAVASKEKEKVEATSAHTRAQTKSQADVQYEDQLQQSLNGVSAGMASASGSKSFVETLKDLKALACQSQTRVDQANMKLEYSKSELKKKRPQVKQAGKEYTDMKLKLTKAEKEVKKIKAELDVLPCTKGQIKDLKKEAARNAALLAEKSAEADALAAPLSQFEFAYSDPEPGFDRSKVKGLVANLITVKDAKYTTALEVTAGGKLYQVVVDGEATGKKLLKNGKLRRRVTIIPLNKISSRPIDQATIAKAKKEVGAGNVDVALSVVGYDDEIDEAMKYVFGSTLLCSNAETAKKVTFHKNIRTRSVTIEGDVYDPSGTLTGGSAAAGGSILSKLNHLQEVRASMRALRQEMASAERALAEAEQISEKADTLTHSLEVHTRGVELTTKHIQASTQHQLEEEVACLEHAVHALTKDVEAGTAEEAKARSDIATLEDDMAKIEAEKNQAKSKVEEKVAKARAKAAATLKETKKRKHALDVVSCELETAEAEHAACETQIKDLTVSIADLEDEVARLLEALGSIKASYETAKLAFDSKRHHLSLADEEISKLSEQRDELAKLHSETEVAEKKLKHRMKASESDMASSQRKVEKLLVKNPWIQTEKSFFGKEGTAYDFASKNIEEAVKRLRHLEEVQKKASTSINMSVMNMYQNAVKEYDDVMEKRRTVTKDKEKIERVISELDVKKNEALEKTWSQVNKDFGSIFSTLLPGTSAKLSPPEGQSIWDGLEVKIAFGDVWKESLTELSGGQRSLVALSLILALLLFKPAPMYILDEIDAALDPSHTQNIGAMLRAHFQHSQFIVVSLKEGMFNNANVLYKTRFVDGVSAVTRFAGQSDRNKENPSKQKSSSAKGNSASKKRQMAEAN